jgi:hypothetical protein
LLYRLIGIGSGARDIFSERKPLGTASDVQGRFKEALQGGQYVIYSELLTLALTQEGRIPIESLSALRGIVPDDVLTQFICDHATKDEFQMQYGHLDLSLLVWELSALSAFEIVQASVYCRFRDWTDNVAARLQHFGRESWDCIDVRPEVIAQWAANHTWLRAPVLLDGEFLSGPSRLHLAEGHTRIGILRGLIRRGILAPDSRHYVWLGRRRGVPSGCE